MSYQQPPSDYGSSELAYGPGSGYPPPEYDYTGTDYSYPPQYGYAPHSLSPESKRKKRGKATAIVGSVVALVAVLLVLNLAGLIPFPIPLKGGSPSGGGGGGTPTTLTFRQAEVIANQTASQRGGSWGIGYAMAVQDPTAIPPQPLAPCNLLSYSPPSGSLIGGGNAYVWGFEFLSLPFTGIPKALFVVVDNDTGTVNSQVNDYQLCPGISYSAYAPITSTVADSPAAVAAAQAHGGTTFLGAHPSSDVLISLEWVSVNSISWTADWAIEYFGPCTGGPRAALELMFNATTLVLDQDVWSNATCYPAPTTVYPVTFASAGSGSSGTSVYYTNVTIGATNGLTTSNLGLAILQPNRTLVIPGQLPTGCVISSFSGCGGPPTGGGWYIMMMGGSSILATYPELPRDISWFTYDQAPVGISGAITLVIVSTFPLSGSGDTLAAFDWEYDVSGSTTL